MNKRATRRAAHEADIGKAVAKVATVESIYTAFSDMFPGTDGTLAERAERIERMSAEELASAIENLHTLRAVAERAMAALERVRHGAP